MSSEICQFCGIEIVFRNIQGKAIPLHPTGSTCPGKQLYRDEARDICHLTTCPRCESAVYFIRHNGGCAWFDELGKPWEKHPCFANDSKLPNEWESYTAKGWKLHFVIFLGYFKDGTGGVFAISKEKLNYRKSYRYVQQYKLQRDGCTVDDVFALRLKSVLLSKNSSKVLAPDGTIWSVSRHTPTYHVRPIS